ncbi:MAG: hypothetical protein A2312_04950 [Candidatus Staskawiczbacteria bacterium RIFOXYB2_FULL_32_9]|uniref:GIY-YIG domain-containing protein n=1 Tax=Candidatus Staskawiczbacteria bacterium RIFOXYD1_FULL_32_13 TaxID=1802234 RepID=A0A1G2JMC4_9BACT|nr:MAG: hypothetical protein UR22_C0013G0003 [Parcubacteria group bacterium GW2011_GWC2_32_10]OGZ78523.1 MAG: hypothetical protein A2360_00015 [Candidatus Staskawiczbacteria bacterium RIFOXYB1_FULL_32_11]OGZ83832.1 MAG: hypothetical protein A2312_04950 [Candidatus Staskawiczbacteria bacterium RIFOXYB2_FULL_32_9]OGZ85921.1 MAG: hypothetical protein A2463_02220 [Candidatus Staskawiczbacteria bacterium RIFOXYC2_FULL_32_10]OGZ87611.1 MAG: hypothetical protein A2561_04045 [Candidatus Staskawiczbacte
MIESNLFEIKKYDFNQNLLDEICDNHFVDGLWPLVYILSDGSVKEAYVGETTDALSRMANHLKSNSKNKLTAVRLIASDKFNKSATLDIESNLIKYISGDGQYRLLNGNIGLANHTYYQKNEVYWDMFKTIWEELKSEGITKNSLDQINNSDLFKYSPYKSLSIEQRNSLIDIIKSLINKNTNSIIVEGGAGTGKTILAIFLFKLLNSEIEDLNLKGFGEDEKEFVKLVSELKSVYPNPSMALVVPMAGFRDTLKKIFKNVKGLSAKMVIGPAEVVKNKFDILVVDESHRLRKRVNLGTYFGAFDTVNRKLNLEKDVGNELDWVIMQSTKSILFYDENQSIKPSDVNKENFDALKSKKNTVIKVLKSQFRVKGGNDYVTYIDKLLKCKFRKSDNVADFKDYEFMLFDSLEEMRERIKSKDKEFGLSRLVAGYSWEWISKNKDIHDMEIDNIKLKWNSVSNDWVNSQNSINEVGCIHTTQGYDLNYAGVIFGKEISYDKEKNEIVILEENYFDKNGKQSIKNVNELKEYIVNIYKTILLRGIKGTYIYACDLNLREYLKKHISLNETRKENEEKLHTVSEYLNKYEMVNVPMYESVGCGELLFADSTVQDMIPVRKDYMHAGSKYFVLKTTGDSMNKVGINSGDLVLCKKEYQVHKGDKVVAIVGDDATIKEYHKENGRIILKPCSTNSIHKPLEFENDNEMKVIAVVVKVLDKDNK